MILRLAPEQAPGVWPKIEPWIAAALEHGPPGCYLPCDILAGIISGAQPPLTLWIAGTGADGIQACAVTEFYQRPRRKSLNIFLCGGTHMHEWYAPMEAEIETFARAHGATLLECTGRDGWGRQTGGRKVGTSYCKDI
jgi:hypothetical protein